MSTPITTNNITHNNVSRRKINILRSTMIKPQSLVVTTSPPDLKLPNISASNPINLKPCSKPNAGVPLNVLKPLEVIYQPNESVHTTMPYAISSLPLPISNTSNLSTNQATEVKLPSLQLITPKLTNLAPIYHLNREKEDTSSDKKNITDTDKIRTPISSQKFVTLPQLIPLQSNILPKNSAIEIQQPPSILYLIAVPTKKLQSLQNNQTVNKTPLEKSDLIQKNKDVSQNTVPNTENETSINISPKKSEHESLNNPNKFIEIPSKSPVSSKEFIELSIGSNQSTETKGKSSISSKTFTEMKCQLPLRQKRFRNKLMLNSRIKKRLNKPLSISKSKKHYSQNRLIKKRTQITDSCRIHEVINVKDSDNNNELNSSESESEIDQLTATNVPSLLAKNQQCWICNKKFIASTTLYIHLQSHRFQSPFPCFKCKKTFISSTSLKIHKMVHSTMDHYERKKREEIQSRKLKNSVPISKHESKWKFRLGKLHPKKTSDTKTTNSYAEPETVRNTNLKPKPITMTQSEQPSEHHQQKIIVPNFPKERPGNRRNRIILCKYCNKTFKQDCRYQSHLKKLHNDKKAFYSMECEKMFQAESVLRVHVKLIHLKPKRYSCNLCEKGFDLLGAYKTHIKRIHDDAVVDPLLL